MLVSVMFGCSVCALQVKHVGHIKHLPLYVLNKCVEAYEDMLWIACLGC